jgi:hypothetical protein
LHSPCRCLLLCYLLLNLCLSHFSGILRRPRFTPPTDFFLHSRTELQTPFFFEIFQGKKRAPLLPRRLRSRNATRNSFERFFRFFLFCFGLVFDTLLW